MPITYQLAEGAIRSLLNAVIDRTHPRLRGVTVAALVAYNRNENGEPAGPAVKLHGVPCLATVKINSLKDRVAGMADATIVLDGDRWADLDGPQREAVLDHELTHLLVPGPTDDAMRPVLKMRQHDYDLGGFFDVVERRREAAIESSQFSAVQRQFVQREFPWGAM